VLTVSPLVKQQLSHQLIAGQFIRLSIKNKPELNKEWLWVMKNRFGKYAFPQFINQYLRESAGQQNLF
jgi:A/G-specific adenine glycosylase